MNAIADKAVAVLAGKVKVLAERHSLTDSCCELLLPDSASAKIAADALASAGMVVQQLGKFSSFGFPVVGAALPKS